MHIPSGLCASAAANQWHSSAHDPAAQLGLLAVTRNALPMADKQQHKLRQDLQAWVRT